SRHWPVGLTPKSICIEIIKGVNHTPMNHFYTNENPLAVEPAFPVRQTKSCRKPHAASGLTPGNGKDGNVGRRATSANVDGPRQHVAFLLPAAIAPAARFRCFCRRAPCRTASVME